MPDASPIRSRDDEPCTTDKRLAVHVADGGASLPADLMHRLSDAIADAGRLLGACGEVRVRVVLDAEMARSHEEFTGVPGTTDVLTFDLTDPDDNPIDRPTVTLRDGGIVVGRSCLVDADILVCVDEATRQAKARGHEPFRELLLYSIHGLLHCLGHDDHDEAAFAAMHAVEDAVLAALGVGPVFRRPEIERAGGAAT